MRKLYVTIGELVVPSRSHDLSVLPGKILLLNPDGSAPPNNPFADDGNPNTLSEIFAYGLRNSFDFTFHPTTGVMFATENGPTAYDEINVVEAGNFRTGFGLITDVQISLYNTLYVATSNAIYGIQGSDGDINLPVQLSVLNGTASQDGVLLRWRTESEVRNLGFHIYRSKSREHGYVRITPTLIGGHGTDSTPHDYSLLDETAEQGRKYWYVIEDVEFGGVIEKTNPIQVIFSYQAVSLKFLPTRFALYQNYPNPFNPDTWIPYNLASNADVSLTICTRKEI